MVDLLAALGLMFVLEGALYALFPDGMRRIMMTMITTPSKHLRTGGLVMAVFGFAIVAVLKGH